eukprot:c10206_g1_i2 orf=34-264(+)
MTGNLNLTYTIILVLCKIIHALLCNLIRNVVASHLVSNLQVFVSSTPRENTTCIIVHHRQNQQPSMGSRPKSSTCL